MPALDGPQWYNHWLQNIRSFIDGGVSDNSKLKEKEIKENPDQYRTRVQIARSPESVRQWASTPFFGRTDFPTKDLQNMDSHLGPDEGDHRWDPNPAVRRRQRMPQLPKDAPKAHQVSTEHPDFLHDMMKGTGVPEHVTVYHYGDIPQNAQYASGSVDPNWPEAVKSGWRSKDPAINRGRLHIYLVPHEDILALAPGEQEVFFRRGTPLRKTPRTTREQKSAETLSEWQFEW